MMKQLQKGILALVIIAIIASVGLIMTDGLWDTIKNDSPCTTTGFSYNSTADNCYNLTNATQTDTNFNDAYDIMSRTSIGVSNSTGYLGTIGTVLGVAAILGIVMGAFYMFKD
jgi:hypothetical protein